MPINYDTLIQLLDSTNRVTLKNVQNVAERLYAEAHQAYDAIEQYNKLDNLVVKAVGANTILGSADDYHNVAVVFAREDEFDYACQFLDKGLQKNSHSVDLLADFLKYGCSCNRQTECEQIFERLITLREQWNWRAYQFSIDYLLDVKNYGSTLDVVKINELVDAFVANEPNQEESYLTKAEWLKKMPIADLKNLRGDETFESVLKSVTNGTYPIKRTPKCDLKLADHYYSLGIHLDEAYRLLERCKSNSIEVQASVNRTYVYLLSALCKMSLFFGKTRDQTNMLAEGNDELINIVQTVFDQFHLAAADASDLYVMNCRSLIETFVCETKIPYPYDDGVINRL